MTHGEFQPSPMGKLLAGLRELLSKKAGALCPLALLLAALQNLRREVLLDDAYITFRCAVNFSQGQGLVFNPGENVLSTTAPGLALVLAGGICLGIGVVAVAKALSVICLFLHGVLLMDIGRRLEHQGAGFAAGLVLCFFPDLLAAWGNEVPLLLMIFALGWWLRLAERPLLCGLTMAFGAVVRPDFAIPCVLLALSWWHRSPRRALLLYTVAGLAVGALWVAFLWHQFGTPLPNTLSIKMEQGRMMREGDPRALSVWWTFPKMFKWLLRRTVFDVPLSAMILLGFILGPFQRGLWIVYAWAAAHLAAYFLLGVPGHYFWYFYPVWLAICLSAGVGADSVAQWVTKQVHLRSWGPAARPALLLALTASLGLYYMGRAQDEWLEQKYGAYNRLSDALRSLVKPGELVLLNEIGQIGFKSGVRVLDSHGLIHAPRPHDLNLNQQRLVEQYEPDYIVFEGWRRGGDPETLRHLRDGDLEVRYAASDGRPIVYRQVWGTDLNGEFTPGIVKRISNASAAVTTTDTPVP